jgi:tetratricopeptide (TPR) repeat protein
MPSTTYMGVDDRRDHSFRIPRPDLSESLGVPNPCISCHQDKTNTWAARAIREHFGGEPPPHFAATFSAADRQAPEAEAALAELVADSSQPVMVRAAALARMSGYRRGYTLDSIRLARKSDPLLRLAAPLASYGLSAENRWRLIAPLLDDELLAVRHQAFSTLLPLALQDPGYRKRLERDFPGWRQDQSINLDYPETQTNLAGAYMALTDTAAAESALLEALALQPGWVPALLNLADLYRFTNRESEAEGLLQKALAVAPEQAESHYAYALWLSRTEQSESALEYFQRAALLAPDQIAYGYALALALNGSGDGAGAVRTLEALLVDRPDDQQLLIAAVTMLRDQQRYGEALTWLDRLQLLRPEDQQLSELRQSLLEK